MKDIRYIIADNVRLYRKRENLTQMELAERAELSLDSIKRVEGGKEDRIYVSGTHEPVVSRELFDKVQGLCGTGKLSGTVISFHGSTVHICK